MSARADLMRRWLPSVIAGVALVVLAILSGVAWRLELEWNGWEGLAWTTDRHLAFPIAMAAFVLWSAAVAWSVHRTRGWRLAILVALECAIAVGGLFVVPYVLFTTFGGWGGGLLSMEIAAAPQHIVELPDFLKKPFAVEILLRDLLFWSVWLAPTFALWTTLRAAAIRSPLWSVPISALVQFWAWPVSMWLLAILDHKGGSDPAHALKSGFVIPWLVFAVGIPLLVTVPPERSARPE